MLDAEKVDLSSIAEALEDHSPETTWWLDPETGEVEPGLGPDLEEARDDSPVERGLVAIEPIPSSEGYGDMEEFIARVSDPHARDLLERAIAGRGAFRRFKDVLFEHPELREAWFAFHDARMERRALRWLADAGIIEPGVAERECARRPDPELPASADVLDPERIARDVAGDLRTLYGERLREVILFGSRARADAHPESDLDLLVVLDEMTSPWEELRRMDAVLWEHSLEAGVVIAAVPVSEDSLREQRWPLLHRAVLEGRPVA